MKTRNIPLTMGTVLPPLANLQSNEVEKHKEREGESLLLWYYRVCVNSLKQGGASRKMSSEVKL